MDPLYETFLHCLLKGLRLRIASFTIVDLYSDSDEQDYVVDSELNFILILVNPIMLYWDTSMENAIFDIIATVKWEQDSRLRIRKHTIVAAIGFVDGQHFRAKGSDNSKVDSFAKHPFC